MSRLILAAAALLLPSCVQAPAPSYYVKPGEFRWAEGVCEAKGRGGLAGFGAGVDSRGAVYYHILCRNGAHIIWAKADTPDKWTRGAP